MYNMDKFLAHVIVSLYSFQSDFVYPSSATRYSSSALVKLCMSLLYIIAMFSKVLRVEGCAFPKTFS